MEAGGGGGTSAEETEDDREFKGNRPTLPEPPFFNVKSLFLLLKLLDIVSNIYCYGTYVSRLPPLIPPPCILQL